MIPSNFFGGKFRGQRVNIEFHHGFKLRVKLGNGVDLSS